MVQKGEFPKPIKIGRSSFWTMEQVQAFIREKSGKQESNDLGWALQAPLEWIPKGHAVS